MIAISHTGNAPLDTFDVRLEHLFTYQVGFRLPPEFIGPAPDGVRINFALTEGTVEGPRLRGRIRPGGTDYLAIRSDGVGLLDLHMTIETHDGAVIYAPDHGVLDHGEDGYQHALSGSLLPNGTPFHVAPRFQTAHPTYLWLNRLQCIGVGKVFPQDGKARCDVYAIQ